VFGTVDRREFVRDWWIEECVRDWWIGECVRDWWIGETVFGTGG